MVWCCELGGRWRRNKVPLDLQGDWLPIKHRLLDLSL